MKDPFLDSMQTFFYLILGSFGLLLVAAVFVIVLSLSGCANHPPKVDVSFWAGDSAKDGISRAQENKTMPCADPEFDNYVCLSYEDLKEIFDAMLLCKQWSGTLMTNRDIRNLVKKNKDVIDHVQRQL